MKEDKMKEPEVDSITGPATGDEKSLDPKTGKQIEAFTSVIMELLHSPKSRDSVTDVLTSSPDPFNTVPVAAMQTNDVAVSLMKQKGVKVPFGVQLAASAALMTDLIHLGYAAAGWEELDEEEIAALYEDTLQMAIERGLKDGSIDPIQLQLETEPLLNEDQKRAGQMFKEQDQLPDEPDPNAMINQHVSDKVRKEKALMTQNQVRKEAALSGPPQQAPQQAPQQGGM